MSGGFSLAKKGSKYTGSYKKIDGNTPLCVLLPKMKGYLKNLKTLKMLLWVEDEKLSKIL